ncbi:hypothetical protein SAMN04490248_1633 [Salinihabitans flavidus]|uniref:Lipoprotein n=1 Tax=Salinihabitans flavidus TaxID=569882 RepID=A0A1H8WHB9_9RHOB|nr:hypothetical protein SAMN04490248_1633 [Salinihabitans flavidus]
MSMYARMALVLFATLFLSACEDPNRYPVSGEECSPDDPVKTIDGTITSCVPTV